MEKFYNIKEASVLLGIKVRTVRQWIIDGKLNAVKYKKCRMWFIPETEIKRMMKNENKD